MSGGSSKAWNEAEIIFTPSGYILVLKQLLSLQEHGMSFLSGCLDGVTRGDPFSRTIVIFQDFFTNKYLKIWGHMKALHLLFHWRYGS